MENILEDFETLNSLVEIVEDHVHPRELPLTQNMNTNVTYQQRGGFSIMAAVTEILKFVFTIIGHVMYFIFFKLLIHQLDPRDTFKKKTNKSGFWKFIIFSAKCGLYLVVFAIAGPFFMLFGIAIIYSKLFKKMLAAPGETPGQFIDKKLSDADV